MKRLKTWFANLVDDIRYYSKPRRGSVNHERATGVTIDQWPPWKQFPSVAPNEVRLNQGNEEAYWTYDWLPFWRPLSDEQKLEYLITHQAPLDWFEWMKPGGIRDRLLQMND